MSFLNKTERSVTIKYSHWIFRLPGLRHHNGLTLGRHIFFKGKESEVSRRLFQHEMIHVEQIERYSALIFYLIYLRDYLKNLLKYRNRQHAYRNIPFEREAYTKEDMPS